jgi:ribonuclease P/MRP protein subunit RPP40
VQFVDEPTREDHILDVVLSNEPGLVTRISTDSPFSTSDHSTVVFDLLFETTSKANADQIIRKYVWKHADYNTLNNYLYSYRWDQLFSVNFTADDIWRAFTEILNRAISLFVPSVETRTDGLSRKKFRRYPKYIRQLASRKQCLWRRLRQNSCNIKLRSTYRTVANQYKQAVRDLEIRTEQSVIDSKNTGAFYKYVNGKTSTQGNINMLIDDNGTIISDDDKKAELLNNYFGSIVNGVTTNATHSSIISRQVSSHIMIDFISFTPTKLIAAAKRIKAKKTTDPDGYSNILLKQVMPSLAYPLSLMYSSLLSISQVPTAWKRAIITPIHKKGPTSNPANYRPISITSVFCKLMERIMVTDLLTYLSENSLITKHQHGFMSRRSTLTNLLESVHDWTLSLANKTVTSVVYIDFTKAFDLVPHAKLLQKLESYGIQGYLLKWINSFLSNRIQCTKIGQDLSSWTPIYSGVIQGSCLGPLLFLLYINDITDNVAPAVTMKMYADDVKLYTEISNGEHVIDLQHTLNQIHCWSKTWQMPISLTKCSIMNISHSDAEEGANLMLGNTTLQESTELKDLGIMIDKHLNFKNHINYVVKTAYARANSIRRCFVSRHLPSLLQAYKIYVRPLLEYNTQVWSPFSVQQITAIENVQRKFTKCMPGLNKLPYYQRLAKLDLESLEIRRLRADLILAYKIVFGIIIFRLI